jgi:uncharacterized protein (TIGR02996 family)
VSYHDRDDLLRAIHNAPSDEDGIRVFSDWLEEFDQPTEVRLGVCPRWFRAAWLRATRSGRPQWPRRQPPDPRLAGLSFSRTGHLRGWDVLVELEENAAALGFDRSLLDHHGTGTVAGIEDCLVLEPYAEFDTVVGAFTPLAPLVGGIPVASRQAAWNKDCVRLALLPPLKGE